MINWKSRWKGVRITVYNELLAALRSTGIPFAEASWNDADLIGNDSDYGVIDLDGAGKTVFADDSMQLQAQEGTIDLFTHGLGHAQKETIQSILNDLHISYRLNGSQFEQDTGLKHYQWIFQLEAM